MMDKSKVLKLAAKADALQPQVDVINNCLDTTMYVEKLDSSMAIYSLFNRNGLDTMSKNLDSLSGGLRELSDNITDELTWDDIGGGTDD